MNKRRQIITYKNNTPIEKSHILTTFFFGFMFLILAILNRYRISGVLAFMMFVVYLSVYIVQHKRILVKYMFLFFGIIFYFIGNSICVFFQVYLVELAETTYYNGSLAVFTFFYWIFLTLLSIFDSLMVKVTDKKSVHIDYKLSDSISLNKICVKYGRHIVFLLSLFLFLSVCRNPAFLVNYNRFEYSTHYLTGALYKIRTIPILLAPVVIISVVEDENLLTFKSKIKSIFLTYLPYILFALWIGNKFGIFWQLFYSLAIPYTIYINLERLKNRAFIKYALLAVMGLFLLILVFYFARGNDMGDIMEKLLRRFAAQGEIWWRTFLENPGAGGMSGFMNEINDVVTSIKTGGEIKQYGVYKIMSMYGSATYVKHYLAIDMRFSAMGFELAYYFFGWSSFVLFPLVVVPIYTLLVNNYINYVSQKDFVGAFALLRIIIVFDSGVCQGDWYRFFSTFDLIIIIMLLFSIIVKMGYKNRELKKRRFY